MKHTHVHIQIQTQNKKGNNNTQRSPVSGQTLTQYNTMQYNETNINTKAKQIQIQRKQNRYKEAPPTLDRSLSRIPSYTTIQYNKTQKYKSNTDNTIQIQIQRIRNKYKRCPLSFQTDRQAGWMRGKEVTLTPRKQYE